MPKNNQGFIPLTVLFLAVVAILMFGATSIYLIRQIHLPSLPFAKSSTAAQSTDSHTLTLPKNAAPPAVNSSLPPQASPVIRTANPAPVTAVPTSTPIYSITQSTSTPAVIYQPSQSVPSTFNAGPTRQPSDLLSSGLLNVTIDPAVPATITITGLNVNAYNSGVGSITYQSYQSGTYKIHFSYQNATYNGQYLKIPDDQIIQINNHQTTNVSADFNSGTVQTSFLWAP